MLAMLVGPAFLAEVSGSSISPPFLVPVYSRSVFPSIMMIFPRLTSVMSLNWLILNPVAITVILIRSPVSGSSSKIMPLLKLLALPVYSLIFMLILSSSFIERPFSFFPMVMFISTFLAVFRSKSFRSGDSSASLMASCIHFSFH